MIQEESGALVLYLPEEWVVMSSAPEHYVMLHSAYEWNAHVYRQYGMYVIDSSDARLDSEIWREIFDLNEVGMYMRAVEGMLWSRSSAPLV